MAITGIEYSLFRGLREQNKLPLQGSILELGEANWYGDVNLQTLRNDIKLFARQEERQALSDTLDEVLGAQRSDVSFEIAKVFWKTFLQPESMSAIDFHGTEQAMKLDLNDPIDLQKQFDLVLNLGTVEHVFNVAQAFKTIHEHTLPGGLMVHGLPFTGWIDHGFYAFNPTFFWDLAAVNNYAIMVACYTELNPLKLVQLQSREQVLEMAKNRQIGGNSLLYVAMVRPKEVQPFRVPIQGYYAGGISREAAQAWRELR